MAGILATGIFLLLYCQGSRQVRSHQRQLLRAVEKRDWESVSALLDPQYHDRWGHDPATAIEDARQIFSQFLSCHIEASEEEVLVEEEKGEVRQRLTLSGAGSPIADFAKGRVNTLTEPFAFRWVRRSWKPWDWRLLEVEQAQLDLGAMQGL